MLPFGVTISATVPQRSEFPEGLMNYPVLTSSSNVADILVRFKATEEFLVIFP
jgi:hypothetical protein